MDHRLFTIAPHAPFLDTLAEAVLDGRLTGDWPREGPFWLADITIVLPTRRARLALADAFARRGHALLPDIRTFGGEADDEEPFLPPYDLPPLPPPVSGSERLLVLARLVGAWAQSPEGRLGFAAPPNPAEILALARSLGELIDELGAEGVSPDALDAIVEGDLAANWQQTLRFLKIAFSAWPEVLAGRGKADPVHLRNERLSRQAMAAREIFGDRPVIAAGSTGSMAATAGLLAAIARLERGALVLPGLDTGLDARSRAGLLDPGAKPHSHPQYGLMRLLSRLGATAPEVAELATPSEAMRTALVRRALAPVEASAHWAEARLDPPALAEALAGVAIIAAQGEDEEARVVAIAARAALLAGKSVGIVSPDRNLARRIGAELARFSIPLEDAAGQPLLQSPAGRLARQILAAFESDCAPIDLMALLRNRATTLGETRARIAEAAQRLEMGLLRGQRLLPGLAGLRAALAANLSGTTRHPALRLDERDGEEIGTLLDRLEAALAPLFALRDTQTITAPRFVAALGAGFTALTSGGDPPPGADAFAAWALELAGLEGEGPEFPPRQLDAVLGALMAGHAVSPSTPSRGGVPIWGRLEARLQSPDVMILCALNEDKWPEPADPGPWLSRAMRLAAGLEPPERFAGLAAHDFEMALGNREVLIAFSDRLGAGPAIPSRLVQRLEAFAGPEAAAGLRERGAHWLGLARRLDAVPDIRPAPIPAPNPPVHLRPRALSVTEIETLFRSPYDIHARHVLGLRPLDPLGEAPGLRERGTLIHEVFAGLVAEGFDPDAEDAIERLMARSRVAFAGLDAMADQRDIWLRRLGEAGARLIAFERARGPAIRARHAEIDGRWVFDKPKDFTLTGRADRVDLRHDETLEILDFKTGSVPTPAEMRRYEAPQLLLEAAMAMAGRMAPLPPAPVTALTYVKIGSGPDGFVTTDFRLEADTDIAGAAEEAVRRMSRHVEAFLYQPTPMAAQIRPAENRRYAGPYDHLARRAEWSLAEAEDEP